MVAQPLSQHGSGCGSPAAQQPWTTTLALRALMRTGIEMAGCDSCGRNRTSSSCPSRCSTRTKAGGRFAPAVAASSSSRTIELEWNTAEPRDVRGGATVPTSAARAASSPAASCGAASNRTAIVPIRPYQHVHPRTRGLRLGEPRRALLLKKRSFECLHVHVIGKKS